MSKATGPTYKVKFNRRNKGLTNYAKRLALVKSGLPRMVVRKTNKDVLVQFVEYSEKGDKTLVTVNGSKLEKETGWPSKRNVWTAYLAGMYAAKLAKAKKVASFVLDIGLQPPTKGGVVFAALKGASDAGLKAGFDEEMVPKSKLDNPKDAYKAKFAEVKAKLAK